MAAKKAAAKKVRDLKPSAKKATGVKGGQGIRKPPVYQ